jgi:hypothetical protein
MQKKADIKNLKSLLQSVLIENKKNTKILNFII